MRTTYEDNSSLKLKAALRKRYLSFLENPAVLDLFCGNGEMYRRVYAPLGVRYLGVDNTKIHDPSLCILEDNVRFVYNADISEYNFFDLDAYGCPWKLLYLICRKHRGRIIACAITDGMLLSTRVGGKLSRFVSAVEGIPPKMRIPQVFRFYHDIFLSMLLDLERRYGWKTIRADYAENRRGSVCYWGILLERREGQGF